LKHLFSKPDLPSLFGVLSVLLTVEFWVHMLVPFARRKIPFPYWPTAAFVELSFSLLLGLIAAIRGRRFWWAAAVAAVGTLGFFFFLFRG
jgi:hypothetical protein